MTDHHQRNNATVYAAYEALGIDPAEAERRFEYLTGQRAEKPASMRGKGKK